MKWTVGGLFILLALLCMQSAHASCGIIVNNHVGADSDCDSVPDQYDNCADIPNQDQRDTDRNGIGDSCDGSITEVTVEPNGRVEQGDFSHISVRVLNNQPSAEQFDIHLTNRQLALDMERRAPDIPQGETDVSEFWIKIPKCQRLGAYDIMVTVTSGELIEQTTIPLNVLKGNVCGTPDTALESTIINTIGRIEVDRGQTATVPIRILNLGDRQAEYDLTLEDIGSLGTWNIEPRTTIPIPEGKERNLILSIQTQDDIDPGTRHLQLTVSSDGDKTTVPFDLYVRAPIAPPAPTTEQHTLLQILFIIVLVVLIIVAIAIAMRTHRVQTHYIHTEKTAEKITRRGKAVSVEDAEDPQKKTNY